MSSYVRLSVGCSVIISKGVGALVFFRLIPVPGDGLANQADQPCQTGQLGPAGPATGHSSIAGQTGQMGQPRPAGQAGHQAMPAIFSLKAGPHSLRKEIHLIGDIQNLSSMLTS